VATGLSIFGYVQLKEVGMRRSKKVVFTLMTLIAPMLAVSLFAQENIDFKMIDQMRDEGFNRSQVMDLVWHLTDVYGPRLANSPSYNQAAQWAKKKFEEFGAENVVLFPFTGGGMPWECTFSSVTMHTPQYMPLIAYVVPYTRGTNGDIRSQAVYMNTQDIFSEADLQKYKGKLRGKIILITPEVRIQPDFRPRAMRLSDEELDDMAETEIIRKPEMVTIPLDEYNTLLKGNTPRQALSSERVNEFFENEGVAVLVSPSRHSIKGPLWGPYDKGIVEIGEVHPVPLGGHEPLPHVTMAAEHYNRVLRLLEKGFDVEMEIEIRATFHQEDLQDYDVIAEIPGTDLKDEIVMIGAHLDGMPAGTGAADNAAGTAMVMEAIRILKSAGAQPRRTIRAALWGSHEIGMLGSNAYIKKHFYDPETQTRLPEYDKLSVYFNSDYYGRILGVYLHGNDLVRPIFEAWMKPFEDVGMKHLASGNSGGSDHMRFINAGLPGFKWINDPIEYFTSIHHTNMDLYDRIVPEDLMQAAVINACWAYLAAMRDEMIPRTPNQKKNNRRWHPI
jgi:carboxypeptidase Q